MSNCNYCGYSPCGCIDRPWDDRSDLEIKYKELEAKNAELEKMIKYYDAYVMRDEKLKIAVEALEFMCSYKSPDYYHNERGSMFMVAREALAEIKGASNE